MNAKETDLTGPDYSPKTEPAHKTKPLLSQSTPPKLNSPVTNLKSPKFPDKETAIFYKRLDEDADGESDRSSPSLAEDALALEDLNIVNGELPKRKHIPKLKMPKNAYEDGQAIGMPPSPSDSAKPKLWSCFPAIKRGSKRNSYKMIMQSPPYMPAPKESSTRYYPKTNFNHAHTSLCEMWCYK